MRDDVMKEFGWYEHEGAYRESVWDMADEIVRLRAKLAAAEADAARLDWLGKQRDGVHVEAGVAGGEYQMRWFATVYTFDKDFRADTVREAIDKAMGTPRTTAPGGDER